jgi:DNA-binding beta-propeller fold protein YncE
VSHAETSVRLLLTVLESDACDVAFEPEGAVVALRRGDAFTVEVSGPGTGVVEVSYDPKGISIGAWSGASTVAYDRAGNRLDI